MVNNSLVDPLTNPVPFIPSSGRRVLWYTCGPTVYDRSARYVSLLLTRLIHRFVHFHLFNHIFNQSIIHIGRFSSMLCTAATWGTPAHI